MKTSVLLIVGLLAATPGMSQSFAVTGLLPTPNAAAAPRATNVRFTLSQPVANTAASLGAVKVFSQQRGGLLSGTTVANGSTLTFDPAQDFTPGELVQATVTTAARSSGGTALTTPQVFQFRAATYGGTGIFSGGSEVAIDNSSTSYMVMADIDNDGDVDLLASYLARSIVNVRLNNGAGVFTGTTEIAVPARILGMVTGDIDGDGDLDLLTSHTGIHSAGSSSGSVSVWINNGSGVFTAPATNGIVSGGGYSSQRVTLADVDGDGDLDMLVLNYLLYDVMTAANASSIGVRLNNGAGVFSGGSDMQLPSGANFMDVGDIDNDGDLDFVTTTSYNSLNVGLNTGNGIFSIATKNPQLGGVAALTLGDLDNDGDLDLLVSDSYDDKVKVRLNDGNGNFSSAPDILDAGGLESLVAADADSDGDLDILTTTNTLASGYKLGVWLNNGAARFSNGPTTTLAGHMRGLTTADVDGDGDLDCIAVVDNRLSTERVSIRLNNGTGTALATTKARHAAALQPAPNPAHDEARLTVPAGTLEVEVLSALGQRLRTVAVPAGATEVRLPLAGLSAGVYLVQAGATVGRLVVE
ncbi:FG-GAP-like repeat-containing protein [Hymenobacter cellulosivorans]|uniref:FG-GAP-like repeat-containing protein n=1 Tax=Hymenobacter cellulosivorans TaxID=2932249 RepID=A0ABY4FCS9_9BACT|nr:FG-GAP-like repeat-containing protein [Hymenobacter cellulosivorans]UOQ54473.1 FG-GAP-like repeat-containing protein [Hymenobacter cellulosivorans]